MQKKKKCVSNSVYSTTLFIKWHVFSKVIAVYTIDTIFSPIVLLMSTHAVQPRCDGCARHTFMVPAAHSNTLSSVRACCQLTTMLLYSFQHIFAMISKIALQSLRCAVIFFLQFRAFFSTEWWWWCYWSDVFLQSLTFYTQQKCNKLLLRLFFACSFGWFFAVSVLRNVGNFFKSSINVWFWHWHEQCCREACCHTAYWALCAFHFGIL